MNQILVTISLLIVATCVKAQGVEGIVFDENREPIPFASVSVIADNNRREWQIPHRLQYFGETTEGEFCWICHPVSST